MGRSKAKTVWEGATFKVGDDGSYRGHSHKQLPSQLSGKVAPKRPPLTPAQQAKQLKRGSLKKAKSQIKALHPKSRAAKQAAAALQRKEKLQGQEKTRKREVRTEMLVHHYFRDRLLEKQGNSGEEARSMEEMVAWMRQYVARHDAEIARLEAQRRRGLRPGTVPPPPKAKERELVVKRDLDRQLFDTIGIQVVDLTDELTARRVRVWDGNVGALSSLKTTHVQNPDSDRLTAVQRHNLKHRLQSRKATAGSASIPLIPSGSADQQAAGREGVKQATIAAENAAQRIAKAARQAKVDRTKRRRGFVEQKRQEGGSVTTDTTKGEGFELEA
eukprot:TRINITY_DN14363_c0_g1_i1.p1 TRINITY_DN14363_c0_g1~~TRINITY_DN14363_c0_g1_i1.p1  ORF type:complete len:330 (-),score=63.30 TRINITY_DN14363_c0_g1_i1:37-1026(-)